MLRFRVTNLRWLANAADLCAHGDLDVLWDGEVRAAAARGATVSAAAYYLLRALEQDHRAEDGTLVPCCAFLLAPVDGVLANLTDHGGDAWTVTHAEDRRSVTLAFGGNAEPLVVPTEGWRAAVLDVCAQITAFYRASATREPGDAEDAAWYAVFREEWTQRSGMSLDG